MYFILQIFLIFCVFTPRLHALSFESLVQRAYTELENGKNAKSIDQRKINFNQALSLYLQAEQIDNQNADLDQPIAFLFSQLNEYPLAILYYYRALKNGANESIILPLLKQTQKQAGLSNNASLPHNFLTFMTIFRKNYLLLWSFLGIIILFTWKIWFPSKPFKLCSIFSLSVFSIFLIVLTISYYTQPLEGVLIKATELFDPIHQRNFEDPILAGAKVQILELISNKDENWIIKIKDSENRMGFILFETIRII